MQGLLSDKKEDDKKHVQIYLMKTRRRNSSPRPDSARRCNADADHFALPLLLPLAADPRRRCQVSEPMSSYATAFSD
jgi:hypothetical protein